MVLRSAPTVNLTTVQNLQIHGPSGLDRLMSVVRETPGEPSEDHPGTGTRIHRPAMPEMIETLLDNRDLHQPRASRTRGWHITNKMKLRNWRIPKESKVKIITFQS